ncbi:MAG: hypothetical protein ABSE87_07740 [Terracidiphilus sp.]|jgi:hypothetical protein
MPSGVFNSSTRNSTGPACGSDSARDAIAQPAAPRITPIAIQCIALIDIASLALKKQNLTIVQPVRLA